MLNLFKIIHIYIDNDSLFWVYIINKKVKQKGVYDLKNGLENLQLYFVNILKVKNLYFFYFKVNISNSFYKVSVLPFVNTYLTVDKIKKISNSIFSKKYLNFDECDYQFFCSKQRFGNPIVIIALNKDIYNCFFSLNFARFELHFDVIEILNKMKLNESKILSLNGSFYYYEFYETKLIDINIFHNKRALRNIEIFELEFDYLIDSDKVIFPKIMSLQCIK